MSKRFSSGSLGLCFCVTVLLLAGCGGGGSSSAGDGNLSIDTSAATIALGRKLFFDERLSSNGNQSCATCHDPVSGFADDSVTKAAPVSLGSDEVSFGNRNAPTAAYASHSPLFGLVADPDQTGETTSKYRGGQFIDGRSSTLVLQAMEPFRNPKEMNNSSDAAVVEKVRSSSYATDFINVFGSGSLDNDDTAYVNIAVAIAAFESSTELNPFTSKYDAYLRGQVSLSAAELRGLALFKDDTKAKCANCHTLDDTVGSASKDSLFTNFEYYNIGTPVNPGTPTSLAVDLGLGGITSETAEEGKFKVPTLRNVELTAPYMHNGVFDTLEQVITHYDLFGTDNITPEVDRNIAVEMGDRSQFNPIGLSAQEIADIEVFMLTLTDGHF